MNKITSNIRNYSFGLILLSCMGGMSCTREADIDMTDTDGVVFSANIGQASRRGDNSWTGGELIGMQVGESVKTYRISDAATGAMVIHGHQENISCMHGALTQTKVSL